MEKGIFPNIIPTNKYAKNQNTRASLGKHNYNKCCKQDPVMDSKMRSESLRRNEIRP